MKKSGSNDENLRKLEPQQKHRVLIKEKKCITNMSLTLKHRLHWSFYVIGRRFNLTQYYISQGLLGPIFNMAPFQKSKISGFWLNLHTPTLPKDPQLSKSRQALK